MAQSTDKKPTKKELARQAAMACRQPASVRLSESVTLSCCGGNVWQRAVGDCVRPGLHRLALIGGRVVCPGCDKLCVCPRPDLAGTPVKIVGATI